MLPTCSSARTWTSCKPFAGDQVTRASMALYYRLSMERFPDLEKENTLLRLQDMCLNSIGRNLAVLSQAGQSLAPLHKEVLLKRLGDHDMLTTDYLPSVTYHLFSSSLRKVCFYRSEQLTDQLLQQLGMTSRQLRKISLHSCDNVTDAGLTVVTSGQVELVSLKLVKMKKLTGQGLTTVCSSKLDKVHIRQCNNITPDGVCALVKSNPSIRKLTLCLCPKLDDTVFPAIAEALGDTLEELDVGDLHTIGDSSILCLAEHCHNITKLNVTGLSRLTASCFATLMSKCENLRKLDISYLTKLGSSGPTNCLLTLPASLTELSLCGIQDLQDEDLFVESMTRLNGLTSVCWSGFPALTDDSMDRILSVIGSNLKVINISGSVMCHLTDECLRPVATHCHKMELLGMGLLREVTGVHLLPVFSNPIQSANIRSLVINTRKMTREVVHAAAAGCPNLCDLDVSGLQLVVDDVLLFALAENCPHLSNMTMKGCVQVTDAGVVELARCCPLVRLVIAGLHQLTDKSIFALANSCPYLEEIYLNGCAYVTTAAVTYLVDSCIPRVFVQHKVPNASPNQVMAKNLDTGEFCRVDLLTS